MSKDKKSKGGDYDVGYGKPPKEHQFPEKTSGNLKGRPKSGKLGSTDVSTVLNEPVKVKSGGKEREMSLFEASLRQLARKALSKNLPAILTAGRHGRRRLHGAQRRQFPGMAEPRHGRGAGRRGVGRNK